MAMGSVVCLGFLLLMLLQPQVMGFANSGPWQEFLRLPSDGTKWALLIAGSNGYDNYRHQADVCHAYQIMKKGGLKDQNIVVMMYDDIAYNPSNPRKGDYTGNNVNKKNFLAVLLGKKSALTGTGNGKVISSGPNDNDKRAAGGFKNLVIYVEACESGSIFQGLLPSNIGVYAMTASNATESSWATYCSTPGYTTCLGDLFSVTWMEDADLRKHGETIGQQYAIVKKRTTASNVLVFGDLRIGSQPLNNYYLAAHTSETTTESATNFGVINQRDAQLVYLWRNYEESGEGTGEKAEAWERLLREMERRSRVDRSVELVGDLLLGVSGSSKLMIRRPAGEALVDDWDCLKSMVSTFEAHCGPLGQYGMKHLRAFANMCNADVDHHAMDIAASKACMHHVIS
uniref:Legumain prodomain domain-containing protein n=1 Tax=Leersia perrieri TaxID=77586 RepID=A0A0D9XPY1_9ORYZ